MYLMEDNLVVFYHLSASEIWRDKKGGIWQEWSLVGVALHKRGTTVMKKINVFL